MQVKTASLEDFYKEFAGLTQTDVNTILKPGINREIGHFNVFDIATTLREVKEKKVMPYNRRAYYKISFIQGRNRVEYADKVFLIEHNALLFATPRVPYHWVPLDDHQSGSFCVFTGEFMVRNKSGVILDELPIFRAGGYPVLTVSPEKTGEVRQIFRKMEQEIASDYEYKYDLIRTYVLELIHYGQKLQPVSDLEKGNNAANRILSLFIELLERQFPIESSRQKLKLRSAREYADGLAIHVNYLNKVLKDNTGRTTTDIISSRIVQEAKILLKETDWNISEIAYCLGFEEVAHFSNFFKKRTSITPLSYRS